jgi:hypothetical protein
MCEEEHQLPFTVKHASLLHWKLSGSNRTLQLIDILPSQMWQFVHRLADRRWSAGLGLLGQRFNRHADRLSLRIRKFVFQFYGFSLGDPFVTHWRFSCC